MCVWEFLQALLRSYKAPAQTCSWCVQGMDSLPAPDRQDVQLRRQDGGYYAAIVFNGNADPAQVEAKVQWRSCPFSGGCAFSVGI